VTLACYRKVDGKTPLIMGILNVTPDSFSDGGHFLLKGDAIRRAFELVDQGADIIDVGGESTRPGSDPVPVDVELARVVPVLKDLVPSLSIPVSVDTMKAQVAIASLNAGAVMINDVYGLRGHGMMDAVVQYDVPAIIMHMHGMPKTIGTDLMEGDVLSTIKSFLDQRTEAALTAGMKEKNILLDPGIGFGTDPDQAMDILRNISYFGGKYPVVAGSSRKRFLAIKFPGLDRDIASAEAAKISWESGADMVRVHNVAATRAIINQSS
jgi:dihydropteroate synthase